MVCYYGIITLTCIAIFELPTPQCETNMGDLSHLDFKRYENLIYVYKRVEKANCTLLCGKKVFVSCYYKRKGWFLRGGSEFNIIPYPHLEHVCVRMGGNAVCVVSKQVNFHCMSHDILSMNRYVRKLYLRC